MSASKYLPLIHPGEILLEEFIKPMGLSLASVSRSTGIPASRLTEITKRRRSLTAETALRLAKFFGTSAGFWVGLQSEHDLEVAERSVGARIEREVVSLASQEPNKAWLGNRRLARYFTTNSFQSPPMPA